MNKTISSKIVIAIPCLGTGGTERQTLSLVRVLISNGHTVCVLCYFEFDDRMVGVYRSTGSQVELLQLDRGIGALKLIRTLREKIRSIVPDIVHVQYMAPGALPIFAAKLAGVRYVFATVHQPYTRSHGWMAKFYLRMASILTTKFVAVSQNTEKSWFGSSHLFNDTISPRKQSRHFTVYNSVDYGLIQRVIGETKPNELKESLSISEGSLVIGAVSRLRHEKGIDILVEAFKHIVGSVTNAHLLLVGSGPDENFLKAQVRENELSYYVTFYGETAWECAIQLMGVMDIVVVPSRFEGFGLTAAEAMAVGKPLVACDTTGLKEVIIDGKTGLLYPVDDVLTLVLALQKLIVDPPLRQQLGKAGNERALNNFSLDIYSSKIKGLYSNYLK